MKAILLASAVFLALPLAAVAQPRVITTTDRSYHHDGPVAVHRVHHPRHRVRHVRHRHHPVVARTVEHHPNGVSTTTVVRR